MSQFEKLTGIEEQIVDEIIEKYQPESVEEFMGILSQKLEAFGSLINKTSSNEVKSFIFQEFVKAVKSESGEKK